MDDFIYELIKGILTIIGFFTGIYWSAFFIAKGWSNGFVITRRQDTITIGNELMETLKDILSNRK